MSAPRMAPGAPARRGLARAGALALACAGSWLGAPSAPAQEGAAPARAATPAPRYGVGGYEALTSKAEADGDLAALARDLGAVLERERGTERAALAALRLAELAAEVPSALALVAEPLARAARAASAASEGPAATDAARRHADALLDLLAAHLSLATAPGAAPPAELAALVERRGIVRAATVLGPFGQGGAGHGRAFAPERALLAADLAGLAAAPDARRGAALRGLASLPGRDALEPGRLSGMAEGATYVLCQVRGAPGTPVRVALASGSSFKAWWNAAPLADVDRGQAYEPSSVVGRVALGDGWQRLWVKLAEPGAGLTVRLQPEGEGEGAAPLIFAEAGAVERPGAPGAVLDRPATGEAGARGRRLAWQAEVLARSDAPRERGEPAPPVEPTAWLAEAAKLEREGLVAEALEVYEDGLAVAAGPGALAAPPHLFVRAARCYERADHLPRADRDARARALWERALAEDPAFVAARVRAARFADEEGRPAEAFRALGALAEARPGCAAPLEAALAIAARLGWDVERRALTEALARAPLAGDVALARLADLRAEDGDGLGLRRALEEAARAHPGERAFALRVADLDATAGRPAEAVAALRALVAAAPGDTSLLRRLAGHLRRAGDLAAAASTLEEAAALEGWPFDLEAAAGAWLEHAEALALADPAGAAAPPAAAARARALRLYEQLLAKQPGRFEVRRLVASQGGAPLPSILSDLAMDGAAAMRDAPPRDAFPTAHSVCLLDHGIAWVHEDGSTTEWVHQIFELRDSAGVERYHSVNLPGEVLALRTYGTDGVVHEPLIPEGARAALMPKLEPGARIELRYRVSRPRPEAPALQLGPFFFRDPELVEPYCLSRWDVLLPAGLPTAIIERNLGGARETRDLGAGLVHHRWENRMAPPLEPEPLMPEREEVLPYVEVRGRIDLDDLAEAYAGELEGRARLTPALREAAASATEGVEGDRAKADALLAFVRAHVTKPEGGRTASEILAGRGGDRLVLLEALLEAAGIPCAPAFAAPSPALSAPQVWDPPRPELLRFPALEVRPQGEPLPLWFADVGRYAPAWYVPRALGGGSALVLAAGGARLETLPEPPAALERQSTATEIRLAGDDAQVAVDTVIGGVQGFRLKEQLETVPAERVRVWVAGQAARLYPRPELEGFELPAVTAVGEPFRLVYRARVAGLVVREGGEGGRAFLKTAIAPLDLGRQVGGRRERRFPLVLRAVLDQVDRTRIDLGDRYVVESVPAEVLLRLPFGSYSLRFSVEPGGRAIAIERRFRLEPGVVLPEAYPRLLEALRRIDEAEGRRIGLRPAA